MTSFPQHPRDDRTDGLPAADIGPESAILLDLARAKAIFQLRALTAALGTQDTNRGDA